MLSRVVAGAIRTYGSVVICEAKAGQQGGAEGAAFTNLTAYLKLRQPELEVYRWPRGNCWFNPLLYILAPQDRRAFLDTVTQQIQDQHAVSGDMVAFLYNAANISEQVLLFLQRFIPKDRLTLRQWVNFMKHPLQFARQLENMLQRSEEEEHQFLLEIKSQLGMLNFFYLNKPEFAMTRHGVNLFARSLDHEDLLWYSEPHAGLKELAIDQVLYRRSLVVVSLPLHDPASRVLGPLFWDSLLARVLELGPDPQPFKGQQRERVLAVLDETHRLPVGRLGESGDFLREFDLGLVEVTPAVVDLERWQRNQHVYQTIISLSPGVPAITELIHERLPNYFLKPTYTSMHPNENGQMQAVLNIRSDFKHQVSVDNPGVSLRSLQRTGRFTGLLQSTLLDDFCRAFWIDFEDNLLAKLPKLLEQALDPNCSADITAAVDYALGLAEFT
ncbi:hypothetical protein [Synechococcus sp. PCC 7335]|uniref:hypothetical protein n=1 Tax=Synechococcus sp. (strain ATCC 29403 / PCC 7335) TaxID=91464 RepID=UPI0006826019|nr:hypothetical protein [Synechococcus sp. PCC 7335]